MPQRRTKRIIAIVLVSVLAVATTTTVIGQQATETSGDQWPEKCGVKSAVVTPGQYSDALGPSDEDYLRINDIEKGKYITVTLSGNPAPDGEIMLYTETRGGESGGISYVSTTLTNTNGERDIDDEDMSVRGMSFIGLNSGSVTFRMYANESGPMCLRIISAKSGMLTRGEWEFSFSKNNTIPANTSGTTTSTNGPGFSAMTTVLAIFAVVFFVRRWD